MPPRWLIPELVLPYEDVPTRSDLASMAAQRIAPVIGVDAPALEGMFIEQLSREGYSIGKGVVIPHLQLEGAIRAVVCLIVSRAPMPMLTIDGQPPDIFLMVAAPPDPKEHLLLLAHLARLAQSQTLLDGLRAARGADEVIALLGAAEQRLAASTPSVRTTTTRVLTVIVASGEQLVDSILLDLVDRGFGDGCIVEAQSLSEAAANEVPLFAGFRDIFGDPGGRRVLLLETASDQAETIAGAVRRLCEESRSTDAQLFVLPIHMQWRAAAPEPEAPEGH